METVKHEDVEARAAERAREAREARRVADRTHIEASLKANYLAAGGTAEEWATEGPALVSADIAARTKGARDTARAQSAQRY